MKNNNNKEFIEYYNENGEYPCSPVMLCSSIKDYVKKYINTERKTIENIEQKVRDAVLVDAVNYVGRQNVIDYALHTQALYNNEEESIEIEEKIEPQILLTAILNIYASYIFNEDIVASVVLNNHMNEIEEPFDANDGIVVLLDFINYILEINGYDKVVTIEDLYEKNKKINDMFYYDKEIKREDTLSLKRKA